MCPQARSGTRPIFCRKAARVRTKRKRRTCEPFRGEDHAAEHRRAQPEERSCYPEVMRCATNEYVKAQNCPFPGISSSS